MDADFGRVVVRDDQGFVARGVYLTGDRRIIVGGYACAWSTCLNGGASRFEVRRFRPDGGLDSDYGAKGTASFPIGYLDTSQTPPKYSRSQAYDVLPGPNGTTLLGGFARPLNGDKETFAIARYTADGTALDTTFGDADQTKPGKRLGFVITPLGADFATVQDLSQGPNGTFYAVGYTRAADTSGQFVVARYRADGSLDNTFGNGGIARGGPGPVAYAKTAAVQPDGDVVVGGIGANQVNAYDAYRFGAAHFGADGTVDSGFGLSTLKLGLDESFANAAVALPGGKTLLGGVALTSTGQGMAFALLDAQGNLDPTWNKTGTSITDPNIGAVDAALLAQGAGGIVAGGQTPDGKFNLVRMRSDGTLDPTFGTNGSVSTDFPGSAFARVTAMTEDTSGRIVAVGIACDGGKGPQCDRVCDDDANPACDDGLARLAMVRYDASGAPPAPDPSQIVQAQPPAPPLPIGNIDRGHAPFALLELPRLDARGVRVRVYCKSVAGCKGKLAIKVGKRTLVHTTVNVPAEHRKWVRVKISATVRKRIVRSGASISLSGPDAVGMSRSVTQRIARH